MPLKGGDTYGTPQGSPMKASMNTAVKAPKTPWQAAAAPKGGREPAAANPLWRALSLGARHSVSDAGEYAPATVQRKRLPAHELAHIVRRRADGGVMPPAYSGLQRKIAVGRSDDPLEHEADQVADAVLRIPQAHVPDAPAARAPNAGGERLQAKCAQCERDDATPLSVQNLQRRPQPGHTAGSMDDAPPIVEETLRTGNGRPLDVATRDYFEPRFGHDFSGVRVHAGGRAAESARAVNAQAYTVGRDIVFREDAFAPLAEQGRRLLAHELSHVVQQTGGAPGKQARPAAALPMLQRKLGDGHDLSSPRFSKLLDLEDVFDGTSTLSKPASGRGVQAIQQALYDIGFPDANFGADGKYSAGTETAVKAFQTKQGIKVATPGVVDAQTMAELDKRFPSVALPTAITRGATWTQPCVNSILCPWSPHTINVLKTKITLKSFDSISWADEEWDGAAWKVVTFPGGGFNTGTEIGVLNSSCEEMAQTLYHEVLHAGQPSTHNTTLKRESYAYRIGEEFSIAMGLSGRPGLRSKDAQGREFADPTKVDTFVSGAYPSVAAGGKGEEIIGKSGTGGNVQVKRPDGSVYVRAANVGEKVPGPMSITNEVKQNATKWVCP